MAHPLSDAFEAASCRAICWRDIFPFCIWCWEMRGNPWGKPASISWPELKTEPFFTWDVFYEDPQAQLILWNALARIAESFKRFDARRGLVYRPDAESPARVSLGANAFIPFSHAHTVEEAHPFGLHQFAALFRCLFEPLRHLSEADKTGFPARFRRFARTTFSGDLSELGVDSRNLSRRRTLFSRRWHASGTKRETTWSDSIS